MPPSAPVFVDTPQLCELLDTNPRTRLIDVRTPGEFAAAHIPGSYNVPLGLLREHRAELTSTHSDPIVLVCASGARADEARTVLEAAGLAQLSVLLGGVTAWEQAQEPMNRGRGAWAMERQVRLVAGSLVLTGVLGSTLFAPLKWVAGLVGAGLTFAAVSNTCAMARLLLLLPHNRAPQGDARKLLTALTASETPSSKRR